MISNTVCLVFILVYIRAELIGLAYVDQKSLLDYILQFISAGYYDYIYTIAVGLLFFMFFIVVTRIKKISQIYFQFIFLILGIFSIICSLANTEFVGLIGHPFTYQWFYYSDFLQSREASNAITANLSTQLISQAIMYCISFIIFSFTLYFLIKSILSKYRIQKYIFVSFFIFTFVYISLSNHFSKEQNWDNAKLENPIISFSKSIMTSFANPKIFSMKISENYGDFHSDRLMPIENNQLFSNSAEIKNIIIFVLESVPAEYIYNKDYKDVVPEFNNYLNKSIVFNNIYAHAPATNKSLFSMLTSVYPDIRYKSITQEYPDINLASISTELKKLNFRTSFFTSGDFNFQRANVFLSNHDFDSIKDYNNSDCNREKFYVNEYVNEPRLHFDTYDDECILDDFVDWIGKDQSSAFFSVFWTHQTHYPYYVKEIKNNYVKDIKTYNRYLNALHHIDMVFGKLMSKLKELKLYQNTLVVVVGDHGEAFGKHGQWGHPSKIYEENVNVPMMIINPRLFSGQQYDIIGGLIDLAPTVMDIMNYPKPQTWQGRSLFASERTNRIYFFAPWSERLFGFRENDFKFIFNATNNTYEIYNLKMDPDEEVNLSSSMPVFIQSGINKLASWVQFQNSYLEAVIKDSDNNIE